MNRTTRLISKDPDIKVVFTDLFDTLIHRRVHPNYVFKIWAKILIRELCLDIGVDDFYWIRLNSVKTLSERNGLKNVELNYDGVVEEIYNRLVNSSLINEIGLRQFHAYCKEADYRSERSVQFLNNDLIEGLKSFKKSNYRIYLVSDFHLPEDIIKRLLLAHGIIDIFDDIFISCEYKKSKESGNLYEYILAKTKTLPHEATMMGDNRESDFVNAKKNGIKAYYIKHYEHKIRNKKNLFGSEKKEFKNACRQIELACKKSKYPFSEYVLHFYFFIECLYSKARQKGIKDLFFLAREGLYLKKLFDRYQELNGLNKHNYINTHYFKASRHSAMQVSLKPIKDEGFEHLRKKYDRMSVGQFLDSFNIGGQDVEAITTKLNVEKDKVIPDFISSETMESLRKNELFKACYDDFRFNQKSAFDLYLKSFGVDFKKDGMVLVDVGWGGTMQECIYEYMDGKVDVHGYYIGLRDIYNIQSKTKRFGLNFSVYPHKGYSDSILLANGQLYEQMLAAPHGSTTGYKIDSESYTIEFHEPNEKNIFDKYISSIQVFMSGQFDELNKKLYPINYTTQTFKEYITDMALRLGLLTDRKKIKFIQLISQGFYQNMGNNKVGINYDPSQIKVSRVAFLKGFLWSPENAFRYLVKIKPYLYDKNLSWLGWIVGLTYYYFKLNAWFKDKFFSKKLL